MPIGAIDQLTRILQASITPVALISGVGLILLSMTNRLARTIDRARALSEKLLLATEDEAEALSVQIRILYRRSKILQLSISLASVSILLASMIILCLFAMYSFQARLSVLVVVFWWLGMVCLVSSLILFIHDITLNLRALRLSLDIHLRS